MRARAAYISSFGTTGILVAAALLMLATVGALVAFHGWPGSASDDSVSSVPLGPARPSAKVKTVHAVHEGAAAGRAVHRAAAARPRARRVSTAGLEKVTPRASSGGSRVAPREQTIRLSSQSPPRTTALEPATTSPPARQEAPSLPAQPVVSVPVDVGGVVDGVVGSPSAPPAAPAPPAQPAPFAGDTQQTVSDLEADQVPSSAQGPLS